MDDDPITEPVDSVCGAYQPRVDALLEPYRCTEPPGHSGMHAAILDGKVLAVWGEGVSG